MRRRLIGLAICLAAQAASAETASPGAESPDVASTHASPGDRCRAGSQERAQVELYFGLGARKTAQGEAAWRAFLARVVTPRFPDGLTVFDGAGQWRGSRGLERERSRMVLILYKPDAASETAIEAIRATYKMQFKQQSVLRVDTTACVSF